MLVNSIGGGATRTHFELYHRLRQLNYDVRAEIKFTNGVRADLVIFIEGTPAVVIEAKGSTRSNLNGKSRQSSRYRELPYPVLYCGGVSQIEATLNAVLHIL